MNSISPVCIIIVLDCPKDVVENTSKLTNINEHIPSLKLSRELRFLSYDKYFWGFGNRFNMAGETEIDKYETFISGGEANVRTLDILVCDSVLVTMRQGGTDVGRKFLEQSNSLRQGQHVNVGRLLMLGWFTKYLIKLFLNELHNVKVDVLRGCLDCGVGSKTFMHRPAIILIVP